MSHSTKFKSAATLGAINSLRGKFMRGGDSDLRLLEETIRGLKKAILGLQQQADALGEQLNSVDTEVRLRLYTVVEENKYLRWQVDPCSNDCKSLADADEF